MISFGLSLGYGEFDRARDRDDDGETLVRPEARRDRARAVSVDCAAAKL